MRTDLKYTIVLCCVVFMVPVSRAQDDFYRVESMPFSIRNLNDYSAVYYQDGIVFCSDRKKSLFHAVKNQNNEQQVDLYYSRKLDSVNWSGPAPFSGALNSIKFEGPVSFSADFSTVYFTRNFDAAGGAGRRENRNFGIFIARHDGDDWSDIRAFEHNDPRYKTHHPALSPDGKYLYFASNRPGGSGRNDLYFCTWQEGGWSAPVNLGETVNTPGDEVFPFYHQSNRLYFASNGPGSSGGLDIFYVVMNDGVPSAPVRLGEPFNSNADDFAFVADQHLESGYLSSNRGRTDNLYSFTTIVKRFADCKRVQENDHTYTIREPNAHLLDTLHHIFEWDLGDGTFIRGIEVEHTFRNAGLYIIKLNVIDSLTGEVLYNQATYDLAVEDIEQVYIESPETCYVNQEIRLNGIKTFLKNFNIQSYLWIFGDGTISADTETTHVFKSPGTYNVQLVVESMPNAAGNTRKVCGYKNIVVLSRRGS